MGRHTWNVAELSELIAAFQEREYYFQEAVCKRAEQSTGNQPSEEVLSGEYTRSFLARQSVHVAQRLLEDDRTILLNHISEEEILRIVMDALQVLERKEGASFSPEDRPIMLNAVAQQVQRTFNQKDGPAADYETTWQWIDLIDTWAVEHNQKPISFFNQPDAYEQILRHIKSKETFLQERWMRCNPETNVESAKMLLIEPLLALIKDEHERETAKTQLLAEADETLSTGISKGLQALYTEYVAEADRIYGPSEPALPA